MSAVYNMKVIAECVNMLDAVAKVTRYEAEFLKDVFHESLQDGEDPITAVQTIVGISLEHDW